MFYHGHIFKSNMDHDYEVKESIGKGAYGSVYLVHRKCKRELERNKTK
jgi:hypothetical protein